MWKKEKMLVSHIFSSPEHEVLRVSYFDWSVVRQLQLRKKSSPKLQIRFQSNFTEMIHRSCSFKILQRIEFSEELWLSWQQSEKTSKIFLSQTVRARAFIFGMKHHLVMLYQNTSNYGPGMEISPMSWILGFHMEIKKEIFKNLLVPNRKG